ncbi:MAG: hypothetical protein AB1348_07000, partial [Nitrospirota bacterium]
MAVRFIDLHTHGIGRYDTRTKEPEDILNIAELHGKAGTGAILPTIYAGTIDEMRKNMEAIRKAIEIQQSLVNSHQSLVKDSNKLRVTSNEYEDKNLSLVTCHSSLNESLITRHSSL